MTPPLALKLIDKAFAEKATFLDLGSCGLTSIPQEISRLALLRELNLGPYYYKGDDYVYSNNQGSPNDFSLIEDYVDSFQKLTLTRLCVNQTSLSDNVIVLCATNLKSLISLEVADNQLTDTGAQAIAQNLNNLTSLRISSNQLTDTGAQAIAQNLNNLTSLEIWGNQLNDTGAQAIAKSLKQLFSLGISGNQLTDIGAQAIAQNLTNLTSLGISGSLLTDTGAQAITKSLPNLTSLRISSNLITDAGAQAIAQNLNNLTSLRISNNQLTEKGIELLAKMTNLTSLYTADNAIDSIPRTVLYDLKALRNYFAAKRVNKLVDNNFVKVILIGNTTSGKSSLANYLVDGTFDPVRESTHGIKLWKWHTDPEHPATDLIVNIWDFGGQDYYHATHTLFRSEKTLFLYLHTDEETHRQSKPEENQYLKEDYWLANIQSLAGERSFAWFVQSKYEPGLTETPIQRIFLNSAEAKKIVQNQFAISVKKAFENDVDAVRHFTYFQENLTAELQKLATEKLQASWVDIRDKHLVKWRKTALCISKKEFWKRCKTAVAGTTSQNDFDYKPEILLKYLRDCGEIIWFEHNAELNNKIYLSVDQLSSELFELLNKETKNNLGIFTVTEARKQTIGDYLTILLEFNLIFKKTGTDDTYIFPQYLPDNPYLVHFQQLMPIACVIRLAYLSRSLVTRFLVSYANTPGSYYWRYGAFIKRGSFHLFVQMDAHQQTVTIHISDGPTREKYAVLQELFQFFTLPDFKEMGRSDGGLLGKDERRQAERATVSEEAKKTLQLSSDGVDFATVHNLEEAIRSKITKVLSTEEAYINVSPVMHQLLNAGAPTPKKIFLSYAHKDELYKKELDTHFAALKRSGLVETWQDREIMAGDDWDKVIKEAISQADIVLLLLSPDFMASDYIWNTELPSAKAHSTAIIPLFIRPCDFEETQFTIYKQQGLPGYEGPKTDLDKAKTRWIVSSDFPNRDEGYLKIVEGVKAKLKEN